MSNKVQKVHSLTGRITPKVMRQAFKSVKRNRGAAGIDRVSIELFEANLEDNLLALMKELKRGSFEPKPLRRVFLPKAPGEFRPLGIPAVRDRIGQEVLRRLLSPVFESRFHPDSFIALDSLDWFLEAQGLRLVRYADDFVVLCQSEAQAKEALSLVEHHLTDHLGLTLSPRKTQVTTFKKGFPFLGFDSSSRAVTMRHKSVEKFKDKVRALTRRSCNMDRELVVKLNRVIRGTANYDSD